MWEYLIHIFSLFCINLVLATSLNMINGYCGLFSLGHAGFFAVGAYSAAAFTKLAFPELAEQLPFLMLLASCLVGMASAAVAGVIVGVPCLRLTGDYLAIATVGFGEIIRIVLLNLDVVGGSRGFPGIPHLSGTWSLVFLSAICVLILYLIIRSSFGRAIISIREDEIASRSMGVDVTRYKVFAFVLGSAFAGVAGALFAHFQQFLHPSNFSFMVSVTVLLMIVVGGAGSFPGAILGAFLVTLLPEALRMIGTVLVGIDETWQPLAEWLTQVRMFLFGVFMVLVMLLRPQGLISLFHRKSENSQ